MKRKVLIIDDELDQCMLISQFLTRKNYHVACAHSIQEGMRKLDEHKPDILLLDNNLPDGLGWGKADEIHHLFPEMLITLISANESFPYPIPGNESGYRQMLKPISFRALEGLL